MTKKKRKKSVNAPAKILWTLRYKEPTKRKKKKK